MSAVEQKQLVLALRKQFYSKVRNSGVKRSRAPTASTQIKSFKTVPCSWFWVLQAGISEMNTTITLLQPRYYHTQNTRVLHIKTFLSQPLLHRCKQQREALCSFRGSCLIQVTWALQASQESNLAHEKTKLNSAFIDYVPFLLHLISRAILLYCWCRLDPHCLKRTAIMVYEKGKWQD